MLLLGVRARIASDALRITRVSHHHHQPTTTQAFSQGHVAPSEQPQPSPWTPSAAAAPLSRGESDAFTRDIRARGCLSQWHKPRSSKAISVKAQKVDGRESTDRPLVLQLLVLTNVMQLTGGDVGDINSSKTPFLARQNRQGTFALTGGFVHYSSSWTGCF